MANQVVEKGSDLRSLITTLDWRDFINSKWKDASYKRRAIASLIQAVYSLELDRQENRTQENSLAQDFWIPFKYKPTQVLIDERDGSIFGAIFEWDRSASLSELKPFKPIGAPRAVLALRGTLIRIPTMRRDFEDDFRFVALESLKDSARFKVTMDAIKSVSKTRGSRNVCIAGHSLGAGFGLQVGKELAKERINVETHLFNPPSVSLAMSLGKIGEKAECVWNRIKPMLPLCSNSEARISNDVDETYTMQSNRMMPLLLWLMEAGFGKEKWVPHLYVNDNDWISHFYIHTGRTREKIVDVENTDPANEQNGAKLFVVSNEDQKFLEAHGMKQWLSSDGNVELKHDIRNSELGSTQLKSLNTITPSQIMLFYYPQYFSLVAGRLNIREATDNDWNILKWKPHRSGKGLMGWIPQLSGSETRVKNDNDTKISNVSITSLMPSSLMPSLSSFKDGCFAVVKRASPMFNLPFVSPAMSHGNNGEKENFVSSNETQARNDSNKNSSVGLKKWKLHLSSMKDAVFGVGNFVPYLYANKRSSGI